MQQLVNVIFKRDGEVVKAPPFMSLHELPRLGETLTLPGSGRKHEVCAVYKKVGARREGGHFLNKVEIELRKPEKK
jgi:hypothetical protein